MRLSSYDRRNGYRDSPVLARNLSLPNSAVCKKRGSGRMFPWNSIEMTSRGRCVYNPEWHAKEHYQAWLRSFKSDYTKAFCSISVTKLDIWNICEAAVKISREGGQTWQNVNRDVNNNNVSNITTFFKSNSKDRSRSKSNLKYQTVQKVPTSLNNKNNRIIWQCLPTHICTCIYRAQTERPMTTFIGKNDLLKSEIMWTLHTITCHLSYPQMKM